MLPRCISTLVNYNFFKNLKVIFFAMQVFVRIMSDFFFEHQILNAKKNEVECEVEFLESQAPNKQLVR